MHHEIQNLLLTKQFDFDRKHLSPPRCHQCSPVSPAAQRTYCTSGTQLLLLGQGPTAAQEVTGRAEEEAERCHWPARLTETAPVGAETVEE